MSDDPRVTVPAELVDRWERDAEKYAAMGEGRSASHKQCRQIAKTLGDCAAELREALVDAAERPALTLAEQLQPPCGKCGGRWSPDHYCAPSPAPVSEPLCRCGHAKTDHEFSRYECGDCGWVTCKRFTPPPVPVSDEAEAAWEEWARHWPYESTWPNERPPAHSVASRESFLAGFRAARQAGKDEQP